MRSRVMFVLQVCSLLYIWAFSLGISLWILHLIGLAHKLHDAPSVSVGISIVAIPVFLTGAGVLTYVFVGLWRDREEER